MSLVYTSVFYNKRNISCIQLTSRMNENIIAYPISSKKITLNNSTFMLTSSFYYQIKYVCLTITLIIFIKSPTIKKSLQLSKCRFNNTASYILPIKRDYVRSKIYYTSYNLSWRTFLMQVILLNTIMI